MRAAAIAQRAVTGLPDARGIVGRLRELSDDAANRFATSAVAIAELGGCPVEVRAHILTDLRAQWSAEIEPEIKLSPAAIIIGTISPVDALPHPAR